MSKILFVDDEPVRVKDIAFGGMRFVAEPDADLELDDEVDIKIDLGRGKTLAVDGVIVWFDDAGQFGVNFNRLTPPAFAALDGAKKILASWKASIPTLFGRHIGAFRHADASVLEQGRGFLAVDPDT